MSLLQGSWNAAWLDELIVVPVAAHDDQADSAAGAFAELARTPSNAVRVIRLSGY